MLRRQDESGVVALNLVITVTFALFAVIQLTRTTIAVQQIDGRVKTIVGQVQPIDRDLTNVPKLDETGRLVEDIAASARPLSAHTASVVASAQAIDESVSSIQSSAQSVNRSVLSIDTAFRDLQPVVRSINDGVAAINHRVDRIIAIVAAIKADLGNVLVDVGAPAGPGSTAARSKAITGHANSIDCSSAVAGSGCVR